MISNVANYAMLQMEWLVFNWLGCFWAGLVGWGFANNNKLVSDFSFYRKLKPDGRGLQKLKSDTSLLLFVARRDGLLHGGAMISGRASVNRNRSLFFVFDGLEFAFVVGLLVGVYAGNEFALHQVHQCVVHGLHTNAATALHCRLELVQFALANEVGNR